MNPCENYLTTSFNFSLAFTSELSDLGQVKNSGYFLRGQHRCPFSLQGQNGIGFVQGSAGGGR